MLKSLLLLNVAVGQISIAGKLNPIARVRGVAPRLPNIDSRGRYPCTHSGRANNCYAQWRFPPPRGRLGRLDHGSRVINMADNAWNDFEAALSGLATPDDLEIQKLRMNISVLTNQVQAAIQEKDYASVGRLSAEIAKLQPKDPAVLKASLRKSMEQAIKHERYEKASTYRDQLNMLKELYLPEYQLAGLWRAETPSGENISVRIEYDDDTVIATDILLGPDRANFMADVSKPRQPIGFPFIQKWDCFRAVGKVTGKRVPGEMYVLGANSIGLLLYGSGAKQVDGVLIVFMRVEAHGESVVSLRTAEGIKKVVELEKLLNQDGGGED